MQRVASIFTQEDWEYIFPYRLPGYDYEFFLEAVALYPAFCNEFKLFYSEPEAGYFNNLSSQDQACRRELATLLAHIVQKTGSTDDAAPEFGGLQVTTTLCDVFGFLAPSLCELNEDSSPYGQLYYGRPGRQYYQRGPIHLTWNGRYGQLSKAYFDDSYQGSPSENVLLNNPQQVLTDKKLGFASAFWVYMTP